MDEQHGRKLYYYFATSENDPRGDPVVLWCGLFHLAYGEAWQDTLQAMRKATARLRMKARMPFPELAMLMPGGMDRCSTSDPAQVEWRAWLLLL